jgi:predicted RNA-binding Zn-ribbon protein involved in translation (DUF1610 family)
VARVTLVAFDPEVCPECGAALARITWLQPALLRHAGYGATEQSTRRWCPCCGWSLPIDLATVSPRAVS